MVDAEGQGYKPQGTILPEGFMTGTKTLTKYV